MAAEGNAGQGSDKQTASVEYMKKISERPNVGGVSRLGVDTVLHLERDAWSTVK